MNNTLVFRGAYLRYFHFIKAASGWGIRMYFTADFSTPVAAEMGWGKPSDGVTMSKLEGELVASTMILTPNASQLESNERQFDIDYAGDFEFHRVQQNESATEELRFQVHTTMAGAAGYLEDYARTIGQSASQLRVSYAKQEALDLQPSAPANPEGQEPISEHLTGEALERHNAISGEATATPLPTAKEVNGGTHATRRRRGPVAVPMPSPEERRQLDSEIAAAEQVIDVTPQQVN